MIGNIVKAIAGGGSGLGIGSALKGGASSISNAVGGLISSAGGKALDYVMGERARKKK